jgi:hypothetical protein
MGNYTSQGTNSNNSHADNNFEALQRNIQHLVKYGGQRATQTDTIHFTSKSTTEFDVDSIKEFMQNGGSLDNLNVLPRRSRYEQYANAAQQTNQSLIGGSSKLNKNELSSIDDDDFKFLKDVLKRHNNQSGGCGCTGAQADNSPTSQDPVDYANMKGGAFSATSDSFLYKSKGGNNTVVGESGAVSATSDNSLGYDILFGGKKDKDDKENKKENDLDSSEDTDEDTDDEESDEDSDEESEDEDDEDDEDYDESAEGDELSRTKGSSTSSSSSESTPELKRQSKKKSKSKSKKMHRHHDYINSSQSAGSSDEIVIDTKYLYSDNNKFYGSDDNSEYYGSLRNRSMMN